MAIPNETIDLIRNSISIEQVISRYVPSLKKRGNNFVGLCPFHSEKTPSFIVSPDKQIFHCFGCHAGGNVFSFVQKIEQISFPESVERVGAMAGISVERKENPAQKENDYLFRINDFAARVYHRQLMETPHALEYLSRRGVSKESVEKFQLGYAPDNWHFIQEILRKRGIDSDRALSCGILSQKKGTDRVFDSFRDRIIFPIHTQAGKAAGFGGRIIGDGQPKYLNTSENRIFSKRNLLYGINHAMQEIRSMDRAIVVEGYLDVIGLHQEGIANVVAPLGTALTLEQMQFLSRLASETVLLFDADAAGAKASLRTLTHGESVNTVIRIARLPQGDPFEYIQQEGARKLLAVIDSAVSPLEFRLQSIARENRDSRDGLVEMFSVIVKECELEAERRRGCELAAGILDMDKNTVLLDFEKYRKTGASFTPERNEQPRVLFDTFIDRSIKELIVLLFHYPFLIEKAMIDFAEFMPNNRLLRDIVQKLFDSYDNDSELSTEKLFDFFNTDEEKQFLSSVVTTDYNIENPESSYTEIYVSVKIHEIDGKISYYTHLLRNSSATGDSSRYLAEIDIWRREKEKLTTYLYSKKSNR